jgi:hypothetical protein
MFVMSFLEEGYLSSDKHRERDVECLVPDLDWSVFG